MTKAIQYREDGKFYLFDKPSMSRPVYPSANQDTDRAWREYESNAKKYNDELLANLAAGKEIINPEVAVNSEVPFCMNSSGQWIHAQTCVLLTPGDIFPCPENIEFEDTIIYKCENKNCTIPNRCYQQGKPTLCEQVSEKGIRLKLKEEVKTAFEEAIEWASKKEVKPVETQDELISEIGNILYATAFPIQEAIDEVKSKFTITRNKNGNE